jgi:hypothetical protein
VEVSWLQKMALQGERDQFEARVVLSCYQSGGAGLFDLFD